MKNLLLSTIALATLLPLHSQAALITADLRSSNSNLFQSASSANNLGNTWSLNVGGVTITITSFNIGANGGTTFAKAQTTPFSEGLGVCNSAERAANGGCSSDPQHRVDNNNGNYDFLLFQFSAPVDVTSVTLVASSTGNSYRDTDASYWMKDTISPVSLAGKTLANMNLGPEYNSNSNSSVYSRTFNILDNWTDTFLLAAKIGDTNDYFKVKTITFETTNPGIPTSETGVPEPSTFAMLGGALVGLAVYRRRQR